MLVKQLESLGYSITACPDGETAVSLLQSNFETPFPFDLIIMDIFSSYGTSNDGKPFKSLIGYVREELRIKCPVLLSTSLVDKPILKVVKTYSSR